MNEYRTYHKYGECKVGTENKYYEVEAIELEDGQATWAFRWARIGYECSKPKEGVASSFGQAEAICYTQWQKKRGKYEEVTAMEALASAAQDPSERPNNGLPAVEVDIPRFHAGKSEKRCKQLCRKYLAKLNLVRASRWDMHEAGFEKQITAVLKSYCTEWARIIKTKAHGDLEDNANAHTAFRIFFKLMKQDAGCLVYGHFQGVGTSW
jgi:hypothetical protein